ncbi:MAG: InlB B-repeat-containing protein [Oscillospiraceae bacterium]|nr:InlB B-repeat-containing protein [Oscillospiraceae bacterium]
MKRILGLLLAAALLLSLLPASAFAADAFTLGADSAEILNCGGKSLHADGVTYSSEDGCVLRDGAALLDADAANLNYADGTLFFTRTGEDGFEICKYDLSAQRAEVLLSREGTVRQMYVVNGTAFYYLSDQAIWRFADGQTERLLADEGLWSFVPTPYGLVYAVGTLFAYSIHAGDTLVTDVASSYHVDFDLEEPRLVYTTHEGDFELALDDAFGGKVLPKAYTGYGEVDVAAMLSETYNESAEEIAAEEQTARNAARQTRAFNGAQGNDGALRGTLTQGQRNAQKRAYQMTDIEWTPKANVLGWGSGLTYTAGTTYKGLPYGQPVYASYVPWSTDLTGFISAVNNSSSKMYTDYSSYNKRAPYYSTDCSAFVSWALNMGSRQTTSTIASKGTLISSSSYANIQVGDYLNNAGSHVVLCTDITYDAGGAINGIEISEATVNSATKYCCQRTWYGDGFGNSLSYFTSKYFGGGYSLYRSNTISNVSYSHVCVSPVYGDVCSTCGYGVSSGSSGSSGSSDSTKFGIDVSAHQGSINWDLVAPQIDFAILRVGYGSDLTNQDDSQWANNVAACERLGIPYGVYLYSYANTAEKAASEAQHVIRLLQGHTPTLPVFYDLEDSTVQACGNATIYSFATIFCNAIEAAGYLPGVYANLNWWRNYLTDPGYDQWYRWVAQYNTSCTYTGTYCMWQNSSSYQMSGITANTVDTNYWYGPFPNGGGSTQPSGTYQVTFKVPTDYTAPETQTVTAGASVTLPSISTKVCGYTFMGWTTSAVSATAERPTFYYAGQSFTPTKNTTLRALFCYYKDGNAIKGDIYYPACSASQTGLAAAMAEVGATDTSYAYRRDNVAPVNFVYNYSGTAEQNTALLNLLKAGMLVNPAAVASYTAYYNTTPGVCKRASTTTTVAATCTTSGTKVTSCAYCGYSKTSTINPLGHNYQTVITPPTCQTSGYTTYTCKREGCNDSYVGDEVPPGDHSLAYMDLGNGTHRQYCTVCNTVISTGAHSYENNYCTLCGAYDASANFAGTYYIAAKRTNDTNWHYMTSALSSTAPSSMRYVIEDSGLAELPSAIASPEADKVFTLTKNPDGTYLIKAEGVYNGRNYLGWTSGNTGTLVAESDAIRATVTGQPGGYVHISFVDTNEATRNLAFNATATSLYAAWYTSQMKNLYLVPVTGALPQHTHSYESEVTTAATCTAAGVRTYTCTLCGHTYTEAIAALQHDYIYHEVAATCTERGYTRATCSRCDYDEILDYTYTAALGHSWQAGTPVAATCTDEGYTPLTCSRCGATDLDAESITAALGHVYAYRDNGNSTHTYYCSRCDTVFAAAEACVFDDGVCIGCGHIKTTASNGDFELVTAAPTDWSGVYLIVNESSAIAFNGSLASPNVKTNYNPVTIADGLIKGNETVRGYAVTVERIAGTDYYTILLGSGKYMGSTGSSTGINATSTKYQNAISLDADGNAVIANTSGTNTYNFRFNTGSTSDRFAFYGASTGLPVRLYRLVQIECLHSYTSAVTAQPTCTAAGVRTYTCSLCGDTYTEAIPATGHSYTSAVTAPTCTAAGYTTYTCARCGDSYTGAATAALGHSLTYTDNGNGTHTASCTRCDAFQTESHSYTAGTCVCGSSQPVSLLNIDSVQPYINENINLIYNVSVPDGYTNPYMVFTFLGARVTVRDYTVGAQGGCCFELTKILPQYMGENIRAELHATYNGADCTDTVAAYSIRQYCVNQLANRPNDTKLKTLLSDLLTYGAAAQQYVGYKTNELVTSGLDLAPSDFSAISGRAISFSGTADAGTDWKAATLVLQSTLAIRFYFEAASVSGLTVQCAINGRTQTFTDFAQTDSGLYYVEMSGVEATEFDDLVTATFYRDGVRVGRSASYSVNAYICGTQNSANASLRALVRALYNYGASASAYAMKE